ncbi:TIGR00162 family protein [Archaeoglobus sulfaticallidus PM70-1]|uniref:TIGR00162 family protein n=1 Tax=Archaeoglobus sulfaticallidus PM70-1 TaxID=387631 RepID=N0BEQ7_9EURY|nr:proteasome assembly chaperone family protein [Archaeoglobus sulfaticallidus]AGK60757.1 TIGR00162 family protein [Archaeoglobus sulfaticallidus PM70-1]
MLKKVDVRFFKSPEEFGLKDPVMIEGLPGIGHVGKLVADHLVKELKAEKAVEIYSHYFPPQVMVEEDGTIKMPKNEVYVHKANDVAPDLVILVGDFQSISNEGHFELVNAYIDIAKKFGVKRIFTLGGYGIGKLVEEPYVLGAANDPKLIEELSQYDIQFEKGEPGGGIIGASGLILGVAQLEGIESACLMGVTSGYMVDPKSAKAVLEVLMKMLKIDVSVEALEERAREMERIIAHIREMQETTIQQWKSDEDLGYFR